MKTIVKPLSHEWSKQRQLGGEANWSKGGAHGREKAVSSCQACARLE